MSLAVFLFAGWKFFLLDIKLIHLLDFYGGASHVTVADYFAAKP